MILSIPRTIDCVGLVLFCSASMSFAQPEHIYGIHDDTASISEWTSLTPGCWITATEAIGSDPSDMGGKAYSAPSNTKIIARLNNGYFPNGAIPVAAKYDDFAARCANYVSHSTGCDTWIIGNETNLAVEWPNDSGSSLVFVSPSDYATCFQKCFNAIKAARPNHQVLAQPIAPWGGPFGAGSMGGYNYPAQPDNWCDYMHKMMTAITNSPNAVTPDGIAVHINTRGWNPATVFNPGPYVTAGALTLDFSWGVSRDWIQFGLPRNLWNLPLYGTESNGMYYWKGGGPETPGDPAYMTGWLQKIYSQINDWNQNARNWQLPIIRCANMYRWPDYDGWTIEAAPNKAQILADLSSAAAMNYTWPSFGGTNKLDPGYPTSMKTVTGITATADSYFGAGFEPDKAFDGNLLTKWASTNASMTHWIVADLGATITVTGYKVSHASAGGESTNYDDLGFYVQAGPSPTGPWTLHTMVRTNSPGTTPHSSTALYYTQPVALRYVRFFFNDPSLADNYARIPEIAIYQSNANVEDFMKYSVQSMKAVR